LHAARALWRITPLAAALGFGAAHAQGAPDAAPPAPPLRPSPALQPPPRGDAARGLPIIVQADEIRGRPDLETVAEGEAEFRRGGVVIRADRLSYEQADDLARATGHVRISKDGNTYSGPELQLHVQSFEGYFVQPVYFFSRVGAGGHAERIDFLDAQRARLTGATYSSCRPDGSGTPAWVLSTDRVKLDFESNEGVAEGAVLRFYDVPILAAPALSFPLTDARKSGWLPPNINLDSKSGLEVEVPYYWNIAPQRDATFTPAIITRRGVGLDTEFRYLEPSYSGTIDYNLLPEDRVAGHSRHALDLHHTGLAAHDVAYQAHVLRVSDDDYWKDFPRGIASLTPRLLPADLQASRDWRLGQGDWTAYARLQQWQVLQDPDPASLIEAPYERSPQLGVRYLATRAGGFEWALEGEYNRFTLPSGNLDPTRNTGSRLHALGSVSRPFITPGWTFTPRLSFNAADYALDRPLADGRRNASRVIPTLSLDSAWVLERDAHWFGHDLRQTLEPRLLYVNTPFRDQTGLPNFDAAGRDFNFESIYTENAFSGVDRVSDAHQVTAGATTRLLDPASGAELLRLGAAQRYLLREQRITPEGPPLAKRFSDLLLFGSTSLVPSWTMDASVQYSPDIDRTVRSLVGARYSPGPFRTVNATYRFTRGSSEQVELGWQWPIYQQPVARSLLAERPGGTSCAGTWYSVGRVNYSTRDTRITDSIVGFEYDAGCWIGRIVAERLSTGFSEATTRLLLQLELVGLSRLGSNPLKVLKDNIPGYRLLREDRPTPLPSPVYD
jgi:LPS-assembly protein